MISSSSAAGVTGVLALFFSLAVFAGQLHIDRMGLRHAAKAGDALYIGVVESVTPPKNPKKRHDSAITFTIEKIVGTPANKAPAIGSTIPLSVYGGIVWDNPNKSPIDRRLQGAIAPKKGERVIAVHAHGADTVELLPATEAQLRIVSILWDDAARTAWLASPDAMLGADLASEDLAAMAAAELEKRGTLSAALLLKANDDFLFDHVHEMEAAPKLRFLTEAAPLAKADTKIRDTVLRLATYEPRPAWIVAAAPIIAMYEPTTKDGERAIRDMHLALVIVAGGVKENRFPGPLDLSAFGDFLLVYETHRPDYQSSGDKDLAKITAHMNAKAKAALAVGFLETSRTSTEADGEYDDFLLHEAARLAKEAPDASIVAPLAKIVPTLPRVTSSKESVMKVLLTIGSAVVAGVPSERARVQDIVQPWIDQKVAAPKDALALYRATVGEPKKGKAEKATFELGAGDSKRLPTGIQVAYTKRDDGWFDVSFNEGEQGTDWGIDPATDGYYEYWVEPYVVVLERPGKSADRIRVTVVPHATKPAELEDPAGYEIAKALAAKAGCPDYDSHENRTWEGRFEYRSKGPGGKSCSILIGTWTHTVIRDGK